jgi:hypothetical protein
VTVWANDSAGNENSSSVTFTVDSVSPLIDYGIGTENNNTFFNRNWIYVNVTVTELNEKNITFLIYNTTGEVNSTTYTDGTRIINWTNLPNGGYIYNVTVIDFSENSNTTSTRTLTLDTTNPNINLTYPTNTSYTSVQTQLNYTLSETNQDICWYSLNGGSTNTTITCGQNVTGLNSGQGSSNWTVWANDSAGNLNSSSVTFFVDSVNPTIDYVNPTETSGSFINQNFIEINVTSTDDNLDTILIRLYNSTNDQINSSSSSSSPNYINFSGLSDGLYFFNATSNDTLNNINDTSTRNVTLDTTNPQISITTPSNNTNTTNTNLDVNYTVSDINLDSCWYSKVAQTLQQ